MKKNRIKISRHFVSWQLFSLWIPTQVYRKVLKNFLRCQKIFLRNREKLPKANVKWPDVKNWGNTNTTIIVSMKVNHVSVVSKLRWWNEIASEEQRTSENISSQLTSVKFFFFNDFPLKKNVSGCRIYAQKVRKGLNSDSPSAMGCCRATAWNFNSLDVNKLLFCSSFTDLQ